ncbi:MAG: hypothetical protein U5K75_02170 [Ahrensia sp.]|nr:hypothetical protein [Ahrensia sp.]
MIKRFCTLSLLLALTTSAYATENWRDKAVELAKLDPKVRDALWSQDISFWIGVDDDGTNRSGFAEYFCFVLRDAGRPDGEFVAITLWDHASILNNSPKQLGKAICQ